MEDGPYPFFVRSQTVERINTYSFDCEAVLTAGDGVGVGKVFHYHVGPFDFHQRVYLFNEFVGVLGRFFYYHLVGNFYKVALEGGAKSTVDSLRMPLIANFSFGLPNEHEQQLIVDFLDRETAKIDALVEAQNRLIELLKEKRQAVITQSVTKGLNPKASMKPSGIDWLGDVPAHWDIRPLKYLVSFASGGTPSKERTEYWEGDVPWASAKDLKSDRLSDTMDHITEQAIHDGAVTLVASGAVVVLVRGMMLARTFPVVQIDVPMAINQDLKALIGHVGVHNGFLAWLLRGTSAETLNRLDEAGHGTKALRMEAWTSMKLPVPPPEEQHRIADFLDEFTATTDDLIVQVSRGLELLSERRSALISAAVTGKIDVRGIASKAEAA